MKTNTDRDLLIEKLISKHLNKKLNNFGTFSNVHKNSIKMIALEFANSCIEYEKKESMSQKFKKGDKVRICYTGKKPQKQVLTISHCEYFTAYEPHRPYWFVAERDCAIDEQILQKYEN